MSGTSLGFRLNVSTGANGVGFVNPYPLPDFETSIESLHLLRRSIVFSNWNRITQKEGGFSDDGIHFQEERLFSSDSSENIALEKIGLDISSGFTIAVAIQPPGFSSGVDRPICITDDFKDESDSRFSEGRGFRLALEPGSGSTGFRIYAEVYNQDGMARARRASLEQLEGNKPFWVFVSWNGSTVTLSAPGLFDPEEAGGVDTEIPSLPPEDNATLWFARDYLGRERDDYESEIGFWAFAQWSKGLSNSELLDEHSRLTQWGEQLGVEIA